MKKFLKEHIVDEINIVLNSSSSKLSKKDIVKLVEIREKIKVAKSKSKLFRIIDEFKNIFFDDDEEG